MTWLSSSVCLWGLAATPGTLTSQASSGVSAYSAQTYASGPGVQQVSLGQGGSSSVANLQWDARGRARSAGPLHFQWSADGELQKTTVFVPGQEVSPTEERVYDAFGRAVQVVRDGEVLDRVYVGAEVVREVTDCAERIWWPSGALDAPGA